MLSLCPSLRAGDTEWVIQNASRAVRTSPRVSVLIRRDRVDITATARGPTLRVIGVEKSSGRRLNG